MLRLEHCCLAIALLIATTKPSVAEVDHCRQETPIPPDVEIVAPDSKIVPELADFSGVWNGAWRDGSDTAVLCTTLVIEQVYGNGLVRLTYSHGAYGPWEIPTPNAYSAVGRIENGSLRFRVPQLRVDVSYRLSGDRLEGQYEGERSGTLVRLDSLTEVGCGGADKGPGLPAGASRDQLTARRLLAPPPEGLGPVHNGRYMPVGAQEPARHRFRGALYIGAAPMRRANAGCPGSFKRTIGGVTLHFFTHGERLVPVERGLVLQPDGDGWMDMIFEPGRVWSEPDDSGWSRASLPFVITSRYGGSVHNGLATFLFNDKSVSPMQFQIVQETGGWNRWDAWGTLDVRYAPGPIEDETALAAAYDEELANRLPVRPLADLPALPTDLALALTKDLGGEHASVGGLVVDGTLYRSGCPTRYGDFPFCDEMRHQAWSVTKSIAGALTMLRMAKKYGDTIFNLKVKDYLEVTAKHDGWDSVTFADLLDMAVGVGDGPDCDQSRSGEWSRTLSASDKLAITFRDDNCSWGPGEVFRYNDMHSFVLATALDGLLKRKEGPGARLWDMMRDEVFKPIGISHMSIAQTLEPRPEDRIPMFHSGLRPTADDGAKISILLQNFGRHGGRQLLSEAKLSEILRKDPVIGLPTGESNRFGQERYHHSFWYKPYRSASGCRVEIPSMLGYGGNVVTLLPNGIVGFRFADGWEGQISWIVRAAEALRPFCSGSEEGATDGEETLDAAALLVLMPGSTFYGDVWHHYVSEDGTAFSRYRDSYDVGRWQITENGQYCVRHHAWWRGEEICRQLRRVDDRFEWRRTNSWTADFVTRREGNPEAY